MKNILLLIALFVSTTCFAQDGFTDSLQTFRENYIQTHEVVLGRNRSKMTFYPIWSGYRIVARFTKADNSQWLSFPTSGKTNQVYKVYGTLHFRLNGKNLLLNVYQSQDLMQSEAYRNYLFLPFTDATNGSETYEGGRYIDLTIQDIQNNTVLLDFNKAYNPYCAYVSGKYNCPIPPKENALPVAIKAGEKAFAAAH
ncbi:MAG TPA: DUF1684 domain-containing protein [Flavisolibacter sp.]|jgi:hypothetical protein|nr:DUF1684 domain-containing protein [Flavisolibacter sp.]